MAMSFTVFFMFSAKPAAVTSTASFPKMSNATQRSFANPELSLSLANYTFKQDNIKSKQAEKVEQVRRIIQAETDPVQSLQMVDVLQRLDIDYHFSDEINSLLRAHDKKFNGVHGGRKMGSLHDVALSFRLLRQHGYYVSAGVFDKYRDNKGRFKAEVSEDIRGMLSLYEASHLGIEGEDELREARIFASKHLVSSVPRMDSGLARHVQHTLQHPFHLNLQRFNAKFFLNKSRGSVEGNYNMRVFHELAQLDFNVLQAMHQRELGDFSRWWRETGLTQQLGFVRDQPVKWAMWSVACLPQPEFSKHRVQITKPVAFVYIIDDIFDTYGTLDELILFTEAVNRWDEDSINKLPGYMKTCFVALDKTISDIADMVLKQHGWDPLITLRKSWAMLCDAFLVEAKWFASGHVPKADEYLRNGMISSGVPTLLLHLLSLLGERVLITEKSGDHNLSHNIPSLISSPASILRLWDDLGSAEDEKQQGNDGSYLDYYMKERGESSSSSIANAREHVRHLIGEEWKKLNKACLNPNGFSSTFTNASLNIARMVQVMYSYDAHQRLQGLEQHIKTLIREPVAL